MSSILNKLLFVEKIFICERIRDISYLKDNIFIFSFETSETLGFLSVSKLFNLKFSLKFIIINYFIKYLIIMVASAGLEPARDKSHWILSPDCLPFQHEANR